MEEQGGEARAGIRDEEKERLRMVNLSNAEIKVLPSVVLDQKTHLNQASSLCFFFSLHFLLIHYYGR